MKFDIKVLIGYLQTLDGGIKNLDVEPAKAIGAHVRGYFQYIAPTMPPHLVLINFHSLMVMHLKTTMKLSPSTIANKLRAI